MPSALILGGVVVWGIHKTEFLAGYWGLKNDEIAVVAIEREEDGPSGQPESITVVAPSKSIWDALELLGVPLVLAVLGAWFQKSQREQSDRIAREQREQDGDETREDVLQNYFDRISALLIDKSLMAIAAKKEAFDEIKKEGSRAKVVSSYDFTQKKLTASIPDKIDRYVEDGDDRGLNDLLGFSKQEQELLEVATDVIQARTLSILRRFEQDSERKSSVTRFLAEADVIARLKISLSKTNLSSVNLSNTDLSNANLHNANLSGADLHNANLHGADLRSASLSSAILDFANLSDAVLSDADLSCADLSCADLSQAKLDFADLRQAKLCGAILINADLSDAVLGGADLSDAEMVFADLSNADLSGTNLSDADLSGVKLRGAKLIDTDLSDVSLSDADLRGANLGDANLSGANLRGANLSDATVTNTKFGAGIGLSDEARQDLIKRGAIFDAEQQSDQ